MSFRTTIARHPAVIGAAAAIAVAVAVWVSLGQAGILGGGPLKGEAFYTSDDGKTYFTASSSEGSPITRNGKEAYRCFVFRCGDSPPFVGYLVRYPNGAPGDARPAFVPPAAAGARPAPGGPAGPAKPGVTGTVVEYRRPGQTTWQSNADLVAMSRITRQKCPDKHTAEVMLTTEIPPTASN